jgi:hypothetical protein
VAFGLLYVVPCILMQLGVDSEKFRDSSWVTLPGFVAMIFMVVGGFGWEGRFFYLALALGVLGSGVFWGLVGFAIQLGVSVAKGRRRTDAP